MTDTPAVNESEVQAQAAPAQAAETAAEKAPAKRTRRTTAAKKAAPKGEAAGAEGAADAAAGTAGAAAGEEPAKKPTRKRTAKKAAADAAAGEGAVATADQAAGEAAGDKQEAPRARRGRPRKASAADASADASVSEAAAETGKAAPKRATRSRKKTDEAAAADPASMEALLAAQAEILAQVTAAAKAAETAEAPEASEAPRKKRAPRKRNAEQQADAAAADAAAGAEAPVAAAPAAEVPAAEGEAARSEQEAPRARRGRPRKAAAVAEGEGQATAEAGTAAADAAAPADASAAPAVEGAATAEPASADAAPAEAPAAEGSAANAEAAAEGPEKSERRQRRAKVKMGERRKSEDGERRKGEDDHRKSDADDRRKQKNERNKRRNKRHERNKEVAPSVTREELAELKVADLRAKATELELDVTGLKKAELVEAVFAASMKAEGFIEVEGVLDIMPDGYGFLRTGGYLPSEGDCYVPTNVIRRNHLRKGDYLKGQTRPARENEKFPALHKIESINDLTLEDSAKRVRFADLTPIYPDERLLMEHGKNTITARVIDLAAPIGKGQRGLIVSPPKAGKTTVLKDIAAAISANNPDVHLMCLLVDERPEEVTDMQRSIKGEVISSTFDMPCENHIAVAELVIERAKRLVENGRDVVVLLDSLTRLARAYNLAQPASGRILSGGVDSTALYPPKKFLGAARNIEHGGSLTILASALVDTGSKMDEVIFEEFKGTGNMELKLDRNLADRRIFPAIDPVTSGTRKEDLLLNPQEAPLIWAVRRLLANMNNTERAMDMLIKSLKQTEDNQEFLIRTAKKAQQNKSGSIAEL